MEKTKLHLGCGKRYLPGYIHIDLAKYAHIDYRMDMRYLSLKFQDESIDLIYISHVIDYLDKKEIISIFKDWRKLLKKGGILRVAVPDFAALVKVYAISGDINLVNGPVCGGWKIRGTHKTIYHKMIFDYNVLEAIFKAAKFKRIRRWDWRVVFKDHKKYDDYSQAYYPHMDKEDGILISLNMEGIK